MREGRVVIVSRFYGSLQGGRGEATRQGTAASGLVGHVRGWDTGVRVTAYPTERSERDAFAVDVTGGSHGERSTVQLADVIELADGNRRVSMAPAFGGRVYVVTPHGEVVGSFEPGGASDRRRRARARSLRRGCVRPGRVEGETVGRSAPGRELAGRALSRGWGRMGAGSDRRHDSAHGRLRQGKGETSSARGLGSLRAYAEGRCPAD